MRRSARPSSGASAARSECGKAPRPRSSSSRACACCSRLACSARPAGPPCAGRQSPASSGGTVQAQGSRRRCRPFLDAAGRRVCAHAAARAGRQGARCSPDASRRPDIGPCRRPPSHTRPVRPRGHSRRRVRARCRPRGNDRPACGGLGCGRTPAAAGSAAGPEGTCRDRQRERSGRRRQVAGSGQCAHGSGQPSVARHAPRPRPGAAQRNAWNGGRSECRPVNAFGASAVGSLYSGRVAPATL